MNPAVSLRADADRLIACLRELNARVGGKPLELEGQLLSFELRQFLVEPILDAEKLVRVDSRAAADGTGDVLVAAEPSDLLLELLSALRARDLDGNGVQAESHGGSFRG